MPGSKYSDRTTCLHQPVLEAGPAGQTGRGGGEGEEQHAATKLQGAARMRTSRKIVKEKREQKAAATKLQGAARIRTSRKIVKERRAARDREPLSPKMEMPGEQ